MSVSKPKTEKTSPLHDQIGWSGHIPPYMEARAYTHILDLNHKIGLHNLQEVLLEEHIVQCHDVQADGWVWRVLFFILRCHDTIPLVGVRGRRAGRRGKGSKHTILIVPQHLFGNLQNSDSDVPLQWLSYSPPPSAAHISPPTWLIITSSHLPAIQHTQTTQTNQLPPKPKMGVKKTVRSWSSRGGCGLWVHKVTKGDQIRWLSWSGRVRGMDVLSFAVFAFVVDDMNTLW